ncbi:MAG: universal stress protein [Dinoroseobacter sp.]|nr:universal stress protein [Dinoroseobacter sp.]
MVHRVLVAVDGTEASHTALEIACALADNYEAALGLLTVTAPDEVSDDLLEGARIEGVIPEGASFRTFYDSNYGAYMASANYQDMERGQRAKRIASMIADAVVKQAEAFSSDKPFRAIKTFVRSGDPAKAILGCAKENNADIIIMGHDQQGRVESLFKSSVAYDVQRDAKCPVLIYCQPKKDT